MWHDLSSEVSEMFGDVRLEPVNMGISTTPTLHDPHEDADLWLAASETERRELARVFAARLAAVRVKNAHALARLPKRPHRREPVKQAARMRDYRKQPEARSKDNARSADWRRRNRVTASAYLREWRKRQTEKTLS